jgi:hypothetical protein
MALSNYLFQSVVGVLLFYGIGGGLFIHVSLVTSLLIALAISSVLRFRDLVRLVGFPPLPSGQELKLMSQRPYIRFVRTCSRSIELFDNYQSAPRSALPRRQVNLMKRSGAGVLI